MVILFLKNLLFWLTRPLAKYMIYPGSISLLMAGAISDAEILKIELINMGGEQVWLHTADNRKLDAMYFDVAKLSPDTAQTFDSSERPTVLLCPGNGMLYPYAWSTIKFYLDNGANIFVFNYGGYGLSEGGPTVESTYRDADAAFAYVSKTKKVPNERITIHALSLGSAPGSYLASKHPVNIVIDRGFARVTDVPKLRFLGWIANFLYPYENAGRIKDMQGKIHVVAADNDALMRPSHVEDFFSAIIESRHPEADEEEIARLRQEYITIFHGTHGDCWLEDKPCYEEPQQAVAQRILGLPSKA
jgi:hypothetical protein